MQVLAYVRWWLTTGKGQNSNSEEAYHPKQEVNKYSAELTKLQSPDHTSQNLRWRCWYQSTLNAFLHIFDYHKSGDCSLPSPWLQDSVCYLFCFCLSNWIYIHSLIPK